MNGPNESPYSQTKWHRKRMPLGPRTKSALLRVIHRFGEYAARPLSTMTPRPNEPDILRQNRQSIRRGTLLHEAAMALALTAAMTALVTRMLATSHLQRITADEQFVARHEAANAMEQLMAGSWEASVAPWPAASRLSNAQITVDRHAEDVANDTQRLTVRVRWQGNHGSQRSVQLVAWRYRREVQMP